MDPTLSAISGNREHSGMLASVSGVTICGRHSFPTNASTSDRPLVIAIHGGTYSSKYFDVPGYSLIDRATALGIPIIALDRPCYGDSTSIDTAEMTVLRNAEILDAAIGEIWNTAHSHAVGIVLVGHSIGGAISIAIAARQPSWPLLGVAISGIGVEPPPGASAAWSSLPDVPMVEIPLEIKNAVMFGPPWTLGTHMPTASYVANTSVPRNELIDIVTTWPTIARTLTAQVAVPVHYRQAEFEQLWITDAARVADFGEGFSASPRVDSGLFESAGHCIDFHRLGAALQTEQLAFALRCAVRTHPAE